ncbi:MAG: hypothetical protein KF691_14820 [Phycisphaeraceae bacterium]|nr:hypothetical protein [Phycisphaeraceae bacterium]
MLARSIIFRLLLAIALALGGPVCLCASAAAKSDSGAMSLCGDSCGCCKSETTGGCHESVPGDQPRHHNCAGLGLQAIPLPPDSTIAKASPVVAPVVWGVPIAERADEAAHAAFDIQRTVVRPATSLLRQHCALIV